MEIKLKSKKVVKVKEFTIADEARLKDLLLKMIKPLEDGKGIELIEPNYNCLLILKIALEDSSDNNIKKLDDSERIEVTLEVQKMLFEGNEKPSK